MGRCSFRLIIVICKSLIYKKINMEVKKNVRRVRRYFNSNLVMKVEVIVK